MGEENFAQTALVKAVQGAIAAPPQSSGDLRVAAPGGVFQVRWDDNASASALGQLAFFAEFLEISGLFERWVKSCPLEYTSPNAPEVRDVLGTWLLSILDGQRRYAHINGLRGDAVAPQILDMTRIISDESLRRALKALAPSIGKNCTEDVRLELQAQLDKSIAWMDTALRESTYDALSTDWILDCDTTVKLLFGNQDGAEIGYNPTKPGRPSHNIHTKQALRAQRTDQGRSTPVATRGVPHTTLAFDGSPPSRGHVGRSTGLIEKDQPPGCQHGLSDGPGSARLRDIGARLFTGMNGLFFSVNPNRLRVLPMLVVPTLMPCSAWTHWHSSASV